MASPYFLWSEKRTAPPPNINFCESCIFLQISFKWAFKGRGVVISEIHITYKWLSDFVSVVYLCTWLGGGPMGVMQSMAGHCQLSCQADIFLLPSTSTLRPDICYMHHKQRLCKIISTRVKFHSVNVLLEQFMYLSF